MAIDKIKKSIFLVPRDVYEKFLIELKNISSVEIISQQDIKSQEEIKSEFLGLKYDYIKTLSSKIEAIINLSKNYIKNLELKFNNEILNIKSESLTEAEEVCLKIENLYNKIKSLQTTLNLLESKKLEISNFEGINLSFSKLSKLKNFNYYFIKIDVKKLKNLLDETKNLQNLFIWVHKAIKESAFLFVLVHKEVEEKFLEISKKLESKFLNLQKDISSDSIEEDIKIKELEIEEKKSLIDEYTTELQNILKENIEKLIGVYYQLLEIQDFMSVQQNIGTTKYIKIIQCWVPQKFIHKVKNLVSKFPEVSVLFFEPQKNEDIPTVLHNRPVSEPYEFITSLYGYPKVGSVDPTEFLAPFFTIFFALCLSDIFYGFLMLLSWGLLRKKVSKTSEYYKLVTLFKYLGITSIIVGIFLDSFLGFSLFKDFKLPIKTALLDPLNRPIDMLKFTFLLGIIQITFGLMVNTVKSFKDKEFLSGIDSLSWTVFIVVFAPIVYKLFFPQDVPQNLVNIFSKISLLVFLFIVVFQSRDIKPIFLKPVNFFVKAYNTIGYYADILSYSRILALALASSAIAQTINLFVFKLFKAELLGIKYVEPALAPIVFVGGHIFNFVMGILGGLVHSARLQYLEFFSKFFVSGGRPIKLFQPIRKQMGG